MTTRHEYATDWDSFRRLLQADIEELFDADLRRLGAGAFHVVLDTDTTHQFPGCLGFALPSMCDDCPDILGGLPRGPGIFLASAMFGEPTPERLAYAVAIAVHEVAHIWQKELPAGYYQRPPRVIPPDLCVNTADIAATFTSGPLTERKLIKWRSDHGPDFVRRLIHTARRCESAGWRFDRELCHATGFAVFDFYERLLADDIQRLGNHPLCALFNFPEPFEYQAAWVAYTALMDQHFAEEVADNAKRLAEQAQTAGTVPA